MALRELDFDPFAPTKETKLRELDFDPFAPEPNRADALTAENARLTESDYERIDRERSPTAGVVIDTARSIPAGTVKGFGMGARGLGEAYNITGRALYRPLDAALRASGLDDVADAFATETPWWTNPGEILKRPGEQVVQAGEFIGVPEERQNFATGVGEGLGQIAGQLTAAILSGGAASATSTAMLLGQGVDQMEEMRQQYAPNRQDAITDAAVIGGGSVTALLERTGLENLLERVPPNIKNGVVRQIADISLAAGYEAAQEVAEGILQRLTAMASFAPDIKLFEDVPEEAGTGATVGGIARGLLNLAMPGRLRTKTEEAASTLQNIIDSTEWDEDGASVAVRQMDPQRAQQILTQEEIESPLPNDLLIEGKLELDMAQADDQFEQLLDEAGLPGIGSRVNVDFGGGRVEAGEILGGFTSESSELGVAGKGISIKLDSGQQIDELMDTLERIGVKITPEVAQQVGAAIEQAADVQAGGGVLPAGAGQAPAAEAPSSPAAGAVAPTSAFKPGDIITQKGGAGGMRFRVKRVEGNELVLGDPLEFIDPANFNPNEELRVQAANAAPYGASGSSAVQTNAAAQKLATDMQDGSDATIAAVDTLEAAGFQVRAVNRARDMSNPLTRQAPDQTERLEVVVPTGKKTTETANVYSYQGQWYVEGRATDPKFTATEATVEKIRQALQTGQDAPGGPSGGGLPDTGQPADAPQAGQDAPAKAPIVSKDRADQLAARLREKFGAESAETPSKPIMRQDGQPYPTIESARAAAKTKAFRKKYGRGWIPAKVEGGYGLKQRATVKGARKQGPRSSENTDILTFIASHGGIDINEGDDVGSFKKFTQAGPLLRKGGRKWDGNGGIVRLLRDNDFFPGETDPSVEEVKRVLADAIRYKKKVYRPDRQGDIEAENAAAQDAAEEADARAEIMAEGEDAGVVFSEADVEGILGLMGERGLGVQAAIDAWTDTGPVDTAIEIEQVTGDEDYGDIPFEPFEAGGKAGEGVEGQARPSTATTESKTARGPPEIESKPKLKRKHAPEDVAIAQELVANLENYLRGVIDGADVDFDADPRGEWDAFIENYRAEYGDGPADDLSRLGAEARRLDKQLDGEFDEKKIAEKAKEDAKAEQRKVDVAAEEKALTSTPTTMVEWVDHLAAKLRNTERKRITIKSYGQPVEIWSDLIARSPSKPALIASIGNKRKRLTPRQMDAIAKDLGTVRLRKIREAEKAPEILEFDPETHSKLVADSPEQIRRSDLARLFEEAPNNADDWQTLRVWLIEKRPDLGADILNAIDEAGGYPVDQRKAAEREAANQAYIADLVAKGERIVEHLRNGGKVILRTQTSATEYSSPADVEVKKDGPRFRSGNKWNYVTRDQINDMVAQIPAFEAIDTVDGKRDQAVIAGAEKDATGAAKAQNDKAQQLARLKGAQKKMRSGKAQEEAGGMFAPQQEDLLSAPAARPSDYGAKNKLVSKDRADELAKKLAAKFKGQLNTGIDPEMIAIGTELAVYHIEAGTRKFVDVARAIQSQLGVAWGQLRPYLRGWYNGARDMIEDAGGDISGMDGPDEVRAGLKELENAPATDQRLEQDRGDADAQDGLGAANVPVQSGGTGSRSGSGSGTARVGGSDVTGGTGVVPGAGPASVGERGDREIRASKPTTPRGASERGGRDGGDNAGGAGSSADPAREKSAETAAPPAQGLDDAIAAQKAAMGVKIIPADKGNIDESLPFLRPTQREDVLKAETRLYSPNGWGYLFTNGTGTGKTYVAGGIAARFWRSGQQNILIVVPSQDMANVASSALRNHLQIPAGVLDDTQSNTTAGVVATTYANLEQNPSLASRTWDLVIADESQKLMSSANGEVTGALKNFRAITGHPGSHYNRARMQLHKEWAPIDEAFEEARANKREVSPAIEAKWRALEEKTRALEEKLKADPRSRVVFLSATPFAYVKTIDYAQGYLFDWGSDRSGSGYNSGDNREAFYMQHFGYRMRYNKLTAPDSGVDVSVMERQFHEWLKGQGVLSGRRLDVPFDYDRKFVLIDDAIGNRIDKLIEFLNEADNGRFRDLSDMVRKRFDYLARVRLLEAIKAHHAIPYIKAQHALGRKVVVFHDFNEGGGINPFEFDIAESVKTFYYEKDVKGDLVQKEELLKKLYEEFHARNPDAKLMKFSDLGSPLETLTAAFPNALIYNGRVPTKQRETAKKLFNTDGNEFNLIVVQSAAGEFGISLHDTTGKHKRALVNLGLPTRPVTAIQEEGRIYREGQASDAIFRYFNTGTNWERSAFAQKIAERASTAENLALGNEARALRDSFINAFLDSAPDAPSDADGKGGKDLDKAANASLSEWDRAKTFYFAQQKQRGRRDQREGIDYFPTPEPVGLKMVQLAGLQVGEKSLEPSAGHGAIGRFLPEFTDRTLIEPSTALSSRAAVVAPGARVLTQNFEDLHINNKYDGIVMNPPYGVGGKTAMEHVSRAMSHLRNGGRIVALIPTGPMADRRLDELMDSEAAKGIYVAAKIKMPQILFEKAGTSVATQIVVFEKQTDADVAAKIQQTDRDYSQIETIAELFDRMENLDIRPRLEPTTKDVDTTPDQDGNITLRGIAYKMTDAPQAYQAKPKGKMGADAFKSAAARASDANGMYIRGAGYFSFPTKEDRDAWIVAMSQPDPPAAEAPASPDLAGGISMTTGEVVHGKTGELIYVAAIASRVERPVYDALNRAAKKHGGFYSSFKGRGAMPGFQFKTQEQRAAFLEEINRAKEQRPSMPAGDNFWAWFGDSKVVDANGAPLVVYHGTDAQFDAFGSNGREGPYFFSEERALSEGYGANLMSVYLRIENPAPDEAVIAAAEQAGWDEDALEDEYPGIMLNDPNVMEILKAQGYDGWMGMDGPSSESDAEDAMSYAVFEPTQIKSTENNGNWDGENPNIRERRGLLPSTGEADQSLDYDAIDARLKELGVDEKVVVRVVDRLRSGALGDYQMAVIRISRESDDQAWTLNHEIIHLLRDLGLFTDYEWLQLKNAARANVEIMEDVKRRYPDLSPDEQIEEAIANMFAYWKAQKRDPGRFQAVLDKVIAFFKAIAAGLRDTGYTNARDILEGIDRGYVGRRSVDETGPMGISPKYMAAAYHGTPHEFDEFDMAKIGTGEGAQAYGWGLYFAGDRGIAEFYRRKLTASRAPQTYKGKMIVRVREDGSRVPIIARDWQAGFEAVIDIAMAANASTFPEIEAAIETAANGASWYNRTLGGLAAARDLFNNLIGRDGKRQFEVVDAPEGRLYTVDLQPAETDYLLWDRPLSEQSDTVKEAISKISPEVWEAIDAELENRGYNPMSEDLGSYTGAELYKALENYNVHESLPPEVAGSSWYEGNTSERKHTSMYLKSLGIRGNKYLDSNSRRAPRDNRYQVEGGQKPRAFATKEAAEAHVAQYGGRMHDTGDGMMFNYVIFDAADVKIVAKESRGAQGKAAAEKTAQDWRDRMGLQAEVYQNDAGQWIASLLPTELGFFPPTDAQIMARGGDFQQRRADADAAFINRFTNAEYGRKALEAYRAGGEAGYERFMDERFKTQSKQLGFKFARPGRLKSVPTVNTQGALMPTDTEEFKRWFGKSVVTDRAGKPMAMYHGTGADIDQFWKGSHFGTAKAANQRVQEMSEWDPSAYAFYHSKEPAFNLIPVYLSIENPLRITDQHASNDDEFIDAIVAGKYPGLDVNTARRQGAQRAAENAGYDGYVYKNLHEDKGKDSYVPFSRGQIKSIFNRGTWDGENPKIRESRGRPPNAPTVTVTFDKAETEQRYTRARQGIREPNAWVAAIKDRFNQTIAGFTRHFINLPNDPKYANVMQQLRKLEAAPTAARERAVRVLQDLVSGMDAADLDIFTRKVILDDLQWEVDQDHALPFAFTPQEARAELAKIDAALQARPDLIAKVRTRKLVVASVAQELVDNDILSADQIKNPAYYRHMVLEYARAEEAVARGSGKSVRTPFWAKRQGSTMDINANLLEAEFDWLTKAFIDIETSKTLAWIKASNLNARQQTIENARAHNEGLVKDLIDADLQVNGFMRGATMTSPLNEEWIDFKRRIAIGLGNIEKLLTQGKITNIPAVFQQAAQNLVGQSAYDDGNLFNFLAWMMDNQKPGMESAGMVFKAISARKEWTKRLLGQKYADTRDMTGLIRLGLAPENHVAWQPNAPDANGRAFTLFTAKTVTEHAVDRVAAVLSSGMDLPAQVAAEVNAAFQAQVRDALTVGGPQYQMVLPEELAATLTNFRDPHIEGIFDALVATPLAWWKRWVLINPRRVIKYNLNNMSGDLDAVIAGNPRAIKRMPQAIKELHAVMIKGEAPSARMREAIERGVFDSGMSVQEIPDINEFAQFEALVNRQKFTEAPTRFALRHLLKVWRALQRYTQFRENWLRYAAYLDYADRLEAGDTMEKVGYGASNRHMVDAVSDPKDRAALLARDLVGDYGDISRYGQILRKYAMPFYSWMEVNLKRYWRIFGNAYAQGIGRGLATTGFLGATIGAKRSAWLVVRVGILMVLVNLWNLLLFPEQEDELDANDRARLHINLGRWGGESHVLRFQGAFSDFLGWMGYPDVAAVMADVVKGRAGFGEVVETIAKAPVKKVLTGLTPMIMLPVEYLSGQKYWPDVFNPRSIRDPLRNVFATFSLEHEYDLVLGKPSRGYLSSLKGTVVYSQEPGEIAYNRIRGMAFDHLEKVRGEAGRSASITARSTALYEWRLAQRYGDKDAERSAFEKMRSLGMTVDNRIASIRAASPLGMLPIAERARFRRTLTAKEREALDLANDWYRETFRPGAPE